MKLSDEVRRAISKSELSRYQIAKESGVQQSGLSRFMAGSALSTDSLDRIAAVLGLRIEIKTSPGKAGKKKRG